MEENKTNPEATGENAEGNSTPEKKEESKQEKDYKTMYENMQKAMKEEREARKERDAKLTELEAKEKAENEKKLKEKGKYEELLAEKEKLLEEISPKAKAWEEYETKKKEEITSKLLEMEKNYPQDLKEKFSSIIEKLDEEAKLDFYTKTFEEKKDAEKQKAFKTAPQGDAWNHKPEAKTIQDMIRNARVIG